MLLTAVRSWEETATAGCWVEEVGWERVKEAGLARGVWWARVACKGRRRAADLTKVVVAEAGWVREMDSMRRSKAGSGSWADAAKVEASSSRKGGEKAVGEEAGCGKAARARMAAAESTAVAQLLEAPPPAWSAKELQGGL